jgi:hypothetical protein
LVRLSKRRFSRIGVSPTRRLGTTVSGTIAARIGQRLALTAVLVGGAGGCGDSMPSIDPASVDAFSFVRDEADLLSQGQHRHAERELREIAQETGVFGVLVTAGAGEAIDPPEVYRPIVDEVTAVGGEALITICSSESCGPSAGGAHTDGLNDAVERVGADPAPPGQGRNVNRGIRDWLDYVAAVAAADR